MFSSRHKEILRVVAHHGISQRGGQSVFGRKVGLALHGDADGHVRIPRAISDTDVENVCPSKQQVGGIGENLGGRSCPRNRRRSVCVGRVVVKGRPSQGLPLIIKSRKGRRSPGSWITSLVHGYVEVDSRGKHGGIIDSGNRDPDRHLVGLNTVRDLRHKGIVAIKENIRLVAEGRW